MVNTLTITCATDPDINGVWHKEDVEDQMRELYPDGSPYTTWIDYIFSHVFNDINVDGIWPVLDMASKSDLVISTTLSLGKLGTCTLTKS